MLLTTRRTPLTVFAIFSARILMSSLGTVPLNSAVPAENFTSIGCERKSLSSSSFVLMSTSMLVSDGAALLVDGAGCEGLGTGTGTGTAAGGCCGVKFGDATSTAASTYGGASSAGAESSGGAPPPRGRGLGAVPRAGRGGFRLRPDPRRARLRSLGHRVVGTETAPLEEGRQDRSSSPGFRDGPVSVRFAADAPVALVDHP